MTNEMRRWIRTPRVVSRAQLRAPLLAASLNALFGCAAAQAPSGAHSAASAVATAPGSGASGTPSSVAAPAANGAPASAPQLLPRLPEVSLDPKQPLRSLPELKVTNIGLHVGGGPNDADTKAPFLRAIAERFPEFMDCYRHNEEPAKGGRFGIDLHIPRAGGHPRVEQPRTALHGPEFRACVSRVFESVAFQKPTHGPTTISYSLLFSIADAP